MRTAEFESPEVAEFVAARGGVLTVAQGLIIAG